MEIIWKKERYEIINLKTDNFKESDYQNNVSNNGIIMFIQSYPEKNKDRLNELLTCLRTNLNNEAIFKIYDIIEPNTIIPADIVNHPKYNQLEVDISNTKHTTTIPKWLPKYMLDLCKSNNIDLNDKEKFKDKLKYRITYKYVIDLINKIIPYNNVVLIANNDIIIDDSNEWKNVKKDFFYNDTKKCLILSRFEVFKTGETFYDNEALKGWSNDIWCYKTPININTDCLNFSVGNAPSCDNAIAGFFYNNGYQIFNWAEKYRIYHYDRCRKNKSNKSNKENGMTITYNTDLSYPAGENNKNSVYTCPYQDFNKLLNNKHDHEYSVDYSDNLVGKYYYELGYNSYKYCFIFFYTILIYLYGVKLLVVFTPPFIFKYLEPSE